MTRIHCRQTSILIATLLSVSAVPVCAAPSSAPQLAPATAKPFIEGLHHKLDRLVAEKRGLDALHAGIGAEVGQKFDFLYMGRLVLGAKRWKALKPAQRSQFLELLEKMVRHTYVRRFKPGKKVKVRYEDRIRVGKAGRVQVRTTIKVKRTRADVWYSMRPVAGEWKIYDIVVDEASQLRTYRRSFNRVLKNDGWDALIGKMKKTAARN